VRLLRRTIALLAAGFAAIAMISSPAHAQAWQPSDGDRLEFDVFRDGSKFGKHVVVFSKAGDQLTVDSDIELKVALGPLTVFHYVHDATERYSAGRLISVAAKTKKDGKWKTLAADAVEGGLKVAGAAFRGLHTGLVIPSTHWNVAQMKQPAMLSTETGAMLPMQVIDQGLERVKVGAGEIEARRYFVKSELDATFWYDAQGRWVKCAFKAQGSTVDYVLRELPT
jgi:hypothetical protein